MASPRALRLLRELQSDPENKICCDCNSKAPQWASVSYGCFMCLECSGKHRGLGVHISFVRSVTMDAWTDEQLNKMKLGGNKRLNEFLSKYEVDKMTPITEKYHSRAAEAFREMLKAEAKGETYNLPPRDQLLGSVSRGTSASALNKGAGMGAIPEEYQASASNKDAYFARKQLENANRAEGVHPSQGGKYVGFGSSPMPEKNAGGGVNELTNMLSTGWSKLATSATAVASQATNKVSAAAKSIDEQARAGQLTANVQSGAQTALTQAQELGTTGWGMLSTLATGVVANVRKLAGDEENGTAAGSAGGMGSSAHAGGSDGDWGGFGDTDSGAGAAVAADQARAAASQNAWTRDDATTKPASSDVTTQGSGAVARKSSTNGVKDDDGWDNW